MKLPDHIKVGWDIIHGEFVRNTRTNNEIRVDQWTLAELEAVVKFIRYCKKKQARGRGGEAT